MSELTVRQAEWELSEWEETVADRDRRVLSALAAGVRKARVHALTGISRTKIDAIEKSARNHAKSEG
ncbi:MAG TPA: hypothetical protein VNO54_06560 [Streptosporangiaceae bacterium]|nr:hypothetical protein [Streptosporangiaceae bacterium]